MISLTKKLTFGLLLTLGSIFLVGEGVSAQEKTNEVELQRPNSIKAATTVEISPGDLFPQQIWVTRGDYGGYLPIVSWEITPNNKYVGLYRGKLLLNVRR